MTELSSLAAVANVSAPDRIVAWRDAEALDARHFRGRIVAWSALMRAAPGTRVALHMDDAHEFSAALFGAWHAGKQPWLPGDILPATLARLATQVDCFAGDIPGGLRVTEAASNFDTLVDTPLDADSVSLVLHTSGSGGEPVAIHKTLRQLDNEVAALERCFGDRLGTATIHGTVSHQHIYGLLFRVLWPLASRRAFHAQRLATPGDIANLPGPLPVVLIASPAHLKRLPPAASWRAKDAMLAAVFSSGGPLGSDAGESIAQAWGHYPIEVFGSTETGGIAWRQGANAAWTALPGVTWRLVDDRLEIRSAHLPNDDWFATNDRVAPSPTGFSLLGRTDRIVKIEERRVSLTAIETRLNNSPLLRAARVLLAPESGARVVAVAIPSVEGLACLANYGKRTLVENLRRELASVIDAVALPRRWRFVETLPVDMQGKVTEARLLGLFRPTSPVPIWVHRDGNCASVEMLVEPDLAMFDGHFPMTPVLPGVALLDWAIGLGREAFATPPRMLRTEVLKFQKLVRPGTRLQLAMTWRSESATLIFDFSSNQGQHASGRVLFASAQEET